MALALTACNEEDEEPSVVVVPPTPVLVNCPQGQLPDFPGNKCYKK